MPRAFNPLTPPITSTTPGVVTLIDPDPTVRWTPSLNNTTDYILQCPDMRTKPITINGGRHVYIFGLWIQLDTSGLGEMVKFVGGANGGIRHIERALLDANNIESDCFKTSNFDTGVVQLKYVRVENLTGNTSSVHADLMQSSGGCGELWVEDFSGFSDYAGFQMQREADVNNNNTAWTITGATRTGNQVVFNCSTQQLAVGDYAGVANVLPSGYNGGHTVTARTATTFTVLLGDLTPAAYTSGGIVQKMAFNYSVGDVRFNRVNVVGRTSTGAPTETLQMYRFGARTAPTPDAGSINQTAYIRQNEDQTRLTYEAWFGEFEATDTYGLPVSGNIDTFVEPDSNTNNYSVIRPVLDTAPTPDQITYPLHPQVKAGTVVRYGNPPGGDYCTHAQALDWSTTGTGGGGGGTPVTPVVVQEVGATSGAAGTTIAATWPAATGTGNLLILGLAYADNSLTVTPTLPAGWTSLGGPVTALGAGLPKVSCALYYKANATSESGTKTVNFNQSVYASLFLAEWDGLDLVPLDQQASATSTGSATATTGTTGATTVGEELSVAIIACNSNFTMTSPTNGYTIQDTKASAAAGTARISAALLYKILTTTGTTGTGVTLSASNPNAGKVATFKSFYNPSTLANATGLVKITGNGATITVSGAPAVVTGGSGKSYVPRS